MKFLLRLLIWCMQLIGVKNSFSVPVWGDKYHLKATLYAPEANVVQPFEVWYDKKLKKSRVDFYYGMVKTFQIYEFYEYGADYKIFPYTDERKFNIEECLKKVGTQMYNIELQTALYPIEDMFEFGGIVRWNGEKIQKWTRYERSEDPYSDDVLSFEFYLKCTEEDSFVCTPIRLRMNGRNLIFQTHVGNFTIEYHSYEPGAVTKDVFDINFPVCVDVAELQQTNSFRTFSPLSSLLPGLSKLANEDRGFDAFIKKNGNRFKSMKQLREQFREFRRKKKSKYSRKRIRFLNLKTFNSTIFNRRLPDTRITFIKNKRKLVNLMVYKFHYLDNELNQLKKYRSYDLNKIGAMQPIQSQLNCGSCWAFATVAALEGAYYMKYRQRIKLSEQVLIDCSWGFSNLGCDGGNEKFALNWIMAHGGIPSHSNYGPYKALNSYCMNDTDTTSVRVRKYEIIPSGDYRAIQIALIRNGPVLAGMYASLSSLSFYKSGIYNDPDCKTSSTSLNHVVVIVGYGYEKNNLYWIIRNSWSKYWGINGHAKVMATNNVCGLSSAAVSIVLE